MHDRHGAESMRGSQRLKETHESKHVWREREGTYLRLKVSCLRQKPQFACGKFPPTPACPNI